jgi:hypothetical protein
MKALALFSVTSVALVVAVAASAGPPTVRQFSDTFVDVNPCTGLPHTVTINVSFVGRGVETEVGPDDEMFLLNDTLVNAETGQRIHAQLIVVENPATGELQVFRQTLTCIRG